MERILLRIEIFVGEKTEAILVTEPKNGPVTPEQEPVAPAEEEVWLTNQQVMDLLPMSERSYYRKKKEYKWKERNIAGITHYLKSDVMKDRLKP